MLSIFVNKPRHLHTTHSWEFMMLEKNGLVQAHSLWEEAKYGEDIIIGNLDTGHIFSLRFLFCFSFISSKFKIEPETKKILMSFTGVWPESQSFRDKGYGPIPSKWKGSCQNDTTIGVPCNKYISWFPLSIIYVMIVL